MPGPAPKPASKRRRRTPPATYDLAQPIAAPAASTQGRTLGIDNPHPLDERMWNALQTSAESRFFSEADWARVAWELWFANETLRKPTANAWNAVQHGLSDLLISPAAKRRAAIELKPVGPDADADAAVAMVGRYRQKLQSVASPSS